MCNTPHFHSSSRQDGYHCRSASRVGQIVTVLGAVTVREGDRSTKVIGNDKSQCCIWTAPLLGTTGAVSLLVGRFRYIDLKEAALSGAAGLWELNRLELVVAASRSGVLVS